MKLLKRFAPFCLIVLPLAILPVFGDSSRILMLVSVWMLFLGFIAGILSGVVFFRGNVIRPGTDERRLEVNPSLRVLDILLRLACLIWIIVFSLEQVVPLAHDTYAVINGSEIEKGTYVVLNAHSSGRLLWTIRTDIVLIKHPNRTYALYYSLGKVRSGGRYYLEWLPRSGVIVFATADN